MLQDAQSVKYHKTITNRFKFWLFSLTKFPSLNYYGIKLQSLTSDRCEVTIKYSRRNTNPFGSIYFAALNGAAELPTGVLLQYHLQSKGKVSMLVGEAKSSYLKKAKGRITFMCDQGPYIADCLSKLQKSGDKTTLHLQASGIDENGVEVMNQHLVWQVKLK